MKLMLAFAILLFPFVNLVHAQSGNDGRFYFQEGEIHNLGNITASHIMVDTFWFENIGEAPIVISFVSTSTAFVVTDWTREAVKPAHRGFISYIVKTSKHNGVFNAIIFIQSNAKLKPGESVYKLLIKGIIGKDKPKPVKKKKTVMDNVAK